MPQTIYLFIYEMSKLFCPLLYQHYKIFRLILMYDIVLFAPVSWNNI